MLRSCIAPACAIALSLPSAAPAAAAQPEAADAAPGAAPAADSAATARGSVPAITPPPQQAGARPGHATVTPTVHVVTGPAVDGPAWRATERALRDAGARRVVRATKPPAQPSTARGLTVYLGVPDRTPGLPDALARLGLAGPRDLADDGYVLGVGGGTRHAAGLIVLAGKDDRGTYYAAQSLRQVLPASSRPYAKVAGLAVRDWPATPVRGVIEGFYGTPWSHEARLDQLDFSGAHKLNSYTYAPKDDPYVREKWRQPHPQADLVRLRELVERAERRHVDFTYTLSPGNSVCYSSPADLQALVAKFRTMWEIGVRSFVVPLDDIDYTKWHCPEDEEAFGPGGGAAAGRAQAHLLNRVNREFIETHRGAAPLQTVPTEYASVTPKPYKEAIAEHLDANVTVQWTGVGVIPPTISVADAEAARDVYAHPVQLWDNYPVNDYATDRLLLGPYNGRERGLPARLAGITANPMIQPSASKIALATVADFAWNDGAYDPRTSWSAAIDDLAGGDPRTAAALRAFADVNHHSLLNEERAPDLGAHIRAFWDTGRAGELRRALERLRTAPDVLAARLPDRRFVSDARPWLDAGGDWAEAALTALDLALAAEAGDEDRARELRGRLPGLVAAAESHRYTDMAGEKIPAVVGERVLDAFVADAEAAHDVSLGRTPRPSPATDMGTHQDHTPLRMTDDDDATWYWNKGSVEQDSYVALDLRSERELGTITLAMGAPGAEDHILEHGVLEYSADGEHWTPLTGFGGRPEVTHTPPEGVEARYVRARATEDQDALLAVRSFTVAAPGAR